MNELPPVCRSVIEYHCEKCRCFHRAGLDKKYRSHMRYAERTNERPPTPNEVLARLALEPPED